MTTGCPGHRSNGCPAAPQSKYNRTMMAVRLVSARDTAGILACLRAAFEPYRHEYTGAAFVDTVLTPDALRRRMTEMSLFVADDDGTIAGTVAASAPGHGEGHLRGMAVLPGRQHRGVGARLLQRALDDLAVRGCRRVTLDTTRPLVAAARFYERNGFSRTGAVRDFFGMPLDEFARSIATPVVIREAGDGDLAALISLINAAYRIAEGHFMDGDRLSDAELHEYCARGTFLVAARDDESLAACVFLESKEDGRVYLGLLTVDPAAQRQGLGRLMMAAAERRCRDEGARAIDILIVNLRTELPAFYGGRGFIADGTAPFANPRRMKAAHFIRMTLPLA
jgi:ribosomal protein S18 acetylase RimI-like enzyme